MSESGHSTSTSESEASSPLARLAASVFVRPEGNIDALDGLRAIAVLTVAAFHCAVFSAYATPELERAGATNFAQHLLLNLWSGVDIFFVLSGFLIGRGLIRDLKTGSRVYYPSFFARRSLRIFPAYYLVLSVSLFAVVPNAPPLFRYLWGSVEAGALRENAWASYLYLSNYLTPAGAPNLMSWAWSLCIEEHFYIVLPPLLWLTMRGTSRWLHAVGLAVGLAGPFIARAVAYLQDPSLEVRDIYFYSHYRFDELFVGVAVAYASVHHTAALAHFAKRAGPVLPLLGVAAITSVWIFGSAHWGNAFRIVFQFPLLAWGTAALLVHGLHEQTWIRRALSARMWFPIARVSYGMYLIHPLVLFALLAGPFRVIFGHAHIGALWVALYAAVVLLSFAIAAAMFALFERPLLDLGGRLARRLRS